MKLIRLAAIALLALAAGCSKKAEDSGGAPPPATNAAIVIEGNDAMQFDTKAFTVKAGAQVTITLKHVGKMALKLMGHNIVIIQRGTDVMAFGQEVLAKGAAPENDYLPDAVKSQVIAATRMLGGGEEDTITFKAPSEPGDYPFLCTFPGHFATMNGVMTVE